MFTRLSRHMRFATNILLSILTLGFAFTAWGTEEKAFPQILRKQVLENGFVPAKELYVNPDEGLVPIGKVIFESKKLSLNGNISCQTCHLSQFGSADGIPNAAAIFGTGEGPQRLLSGAKLLPRNTLPFWGRGAKGFNTFFWDGKVDFSNSQKISQFGSQPPSDDALVTAAHLPLVEIREMLDEDDFVKAHKQESVGKSQEVYKAIADNLRQFEPQATKSLAEYLHKPVEQLTYTDYARSIAAFRGGFRNSDSMLSGSLASPPPPRGGRREERGNEEDETESWSHLQGAGRLGRGQRRQDAC
jgi:cytochrome c peroxidase